MSVTGESLLRAVCFASLSCYAFKARKALLKHGEPASIATATSVLREVGVPAPLIPRVLSKLLLLLTVPNRSEAIKELHAYKARFEAGKASRGNFIAAAHLQRVFLLSGAFHPDFSITTGYPDYLLSPPALSDVCYAFFECLQAAVALAPACVLHPQFRFVSAVVESSLVVTSTARGDAYHMRAMYVTFLAAAVAVRGRPALTAQLRAAIQSETNLPWLLNRMCLPDAYPEDAAMMELLSGMQDVSIPLATSRLSTTSDLDAFFAYSGVQPRTLSIANELLKMMLKFSTSLESVRAFVRRGGVPRLVLSITPYVQFEEVASAFSSMLLQLMRVLPSIKKELVAAGAHRLLHVMIVDRVTFNNGTNYATEALESLAHELPACEDWILLQSAAMHLPPPTLSLAEAVDELRALAALSSARSPEQPVLCTRISFELSRMLHAVALCATHSGSIEFDYAYCELLEAVAMSSAIGATACLRSNAQNATLPMMTAHPNDSKVALPVVKCHYACLHHHPQLIDTPIFQNKGVMDMFKFLSKSRLAVSADGVDHAKAVLDLLRGHK